MKLGVETGRVLGLTLLTILRQSDPAASVARGTSRRFSHKYLSVPVRRVLLLNKFTVNYCVNYQSCSVRRFELSADQQARSLKPQFTQRSRVGRNRTRRRLTPTLRQLTSTAAENFVEYATISPDGNRAKASALAPFVTFLYKG